MPTIRKSGAIADCQIDAVRVVGVEDVTAIILMAAKFGIPVGPHGEIVFD